MRKSVVLPAPLGPITPTMPPRGRVKLRSSMRSRSPYAFLRPRASTTDRKSTRLNSSHTVIYTLSLHDALPIFGADHADDAAAREGEVEIVDEEQIAVRLSEAAGFDDRSEEHTSELQSHSDLHSFPTRRSSDLWGRSRRRCRRAGG